MIKIHDIADGVRAGNVRALAKAITLIESGADIVVLRHPESVKRVRAAIEELMTVPE